MQGKELLQHFKRLSDQDQNRILINAYQQVAALHDNGKSFDSFDWRDCSLEEGIFQINAKVDDYFDDESFIRNLLDYAKVIYCLTTGNTSAESMSVDAGRKIDSDVLREIVLTISRHSDSMEPLLQKLRQPYVDEETFFSGYTTADEKEEREAAERQRYEEELSLTQDHDDSRKRWRARIIMLILMVICIGSYRGYKAHKEAQQRMVEQHYYELREQQRQIREMAKDFRLVCEKDSVTNESVMRIKRVAPETEKTDSQNH